MIRDLYKKLPMAPNFTYNEFVRSTLAIHNNIENIPNEQQWKNIEYVAQYVLQPVRNKFGTIFILSGFRCDELNKKANGSKSSFHRFGNAVDFEPSNNIKMYDVLEYIALNLNFTELIAEFFPNGWIHVALAENREHEKVIKLKDTNHNFEVVDILKLEKLYKN
ncbi:MAG: D-Ala-D-Ala carboxypeptidase family metallohydrolase [Acidithiobacillus sp.]|jgi:hypothetical protein|uniref:D-Ala-D-Ala carboxypeptidase family metallohydrolase n=1 Tax=Acidithiobacillus sp. TaxID=1872118 RepID=UPI0035605EC2